MGKKNPNLSHHKFPVTVTCFCTTVILTVCVLCNFLVG